MALQRLFILSFALFLLLENGEAQTTVFEKDVTDNVFNKERGPNLKKFSHFYMEFGGMALDKDGANIIYPASNVFAAGFRKKRKVFNFYSVGYDISVQSHKYRLKQNEEKIFPNALLHQREKIVLTNGTFELYQRFTIGKTGNMMGLFVDTGIFGTWTFAGIHQTRDVFDDPVSNSGLQIVRNRRLKYINPFLYGAKARIGYNKVALYGMYQISDILDDTYLYPELPRLSVGLELSFY